MACVLDVCVTHTGQENPVLTVLLGSVLVHRVFLALTVSMEHVCKVGTYLSDIICMYFILRYDMPKTARIHNQQIVLSQYCNDERPYLEP